MTAKRLGAIPYPAILALKDGGFAVLARRRREGQGPPRRSDRRGPRREVPLEEAEALSSGEAILVTRRLGGRRGRSQHLRLPLVLAVDPALPPAARACAGRLAVRAAVRAGDADLLPARGRQGAGPQGHVDAGRARRRHGDARPVRDGPAVPARPIRSSHTTNRIDVELGRRLFHHLFRLPLAYFETRAAGQTVARMRELETIRSFLTGQGLTVAARSRLHARLHRGDVHLFGQAHAGGADLDPGLRPHRRRASAGPARADQRAVQPRRALAAVPGRIDRRRADAEGGERRADDAGAMGGAARLLREQVVRRRRHRRARPEHDPVREQGHDRADPVLRRAVGDRGLDVGRRTDRLQHDREPGGAADPAPVAALAGFPAGAGFGRAARRHSQRAARARAAESADPAAAARGDRVPQRDDALPAGRGGRAAQRDAVDRRGRSDRHRRPLGLGQVDADQARPAPLQPADAAR